MLLAIDTSSTACSCALWADGLVASKEHFGEKGHAELLLPQIAELLKDAECDIKQVSKIAVTTGPGSFTGVRVGIAAARGLALSLDCDLVGITSFDALAATLIAHQDNDTSPLTIGDKFSAVIDARRGQVYIQSFIFNGFGQRPEPLADGVAMDVSTAKELEQSFLVGGGAKLLGEVDAFFTSDDFEHILAKNFCQYVDMFATQNTLPVPLYLRAPDAAPAFSFLKKKAK